MDANEDQFLAENDSEEFANYFVKRNQMASDGKENIEPQNSTEEEILIENIGNEVMSQAKFEGKWPEPGTDGKSSDPQLSVEEAVLCENIKEDSIFSECCVEEEFQSKETENGLSDSQEIKEKILQKIIREGLHLDSEVLLLKDVEDEVLALLQNKEKKLLASEVCADNQTWNISKKEESTSQENMENPKLPNCLEKNSEKVSSNDRIENDKEEMYAVSVSTETIFCTNNIPTQQPKAKMNMSSVARLDEQVNEEKNSFKVSYFLTFLIATQNKNIYE